MPLADLLKELVERHGSDLHLVTGVPPVLRIDGDLTAYGKSELGDDEVWKLLEPFLTDRQKMDLGNRQDIHTSIRLDDVIANERYGGAGHFRACIFWDSNGLSAALRVIPHIIPSLSQLFSRETDAIFRSITNVKRGLVIIAGPTGSGKSTTLASIVDSINAERNERIFTIEDPVEYLYSSKKSLISQREVGVDVESYEQGGISAMKADPDVVLLGELKVPESVRVALALADTGHLVFATMHARSSSEAVGRLIESFPETKQTMQSTIARTLIAVVTQQLVPKANGGGRVAAHEIMTVNPRIRQMIDNGHTDLEVAIEAGRNEGMCTMDDSLTSLYRNGTISYETACARASDWKMMGPPPVQANEAVAAEAPSNGQSALAQVFGVDIGSIAADLMDAKVSWSKANPDDETSIIRIAHAIIWQAIHDKSSEIRIEPDDKGVHVQYRIDGVHLVDVMTVPKHVEQQLIARYKMFAEMNIAKHNIRQDGRIPIKHEGKDYNLHVSCMPTKWGEMIVIHILDKTRVE